MAAFCTQCGAAIPPGAQVRPRGMDRQELDARIRQRRPGDNRLRRGTPFDGGDAPVPGYVPFEPDPDDALAVREAGQQDQPHVDNTAPDFDERAAEAARPLPPPPPVEPAGYTSAPYPDEQEPEDAYVPPPQPTWEQPQYADEPQPDEPYGAPDDAYPYAWEAAEEPRRGGGGMLPILGFAALAVLALGVGAALAGIFTGGVANASATPTPSVAATTSTAPSVTESPTESGASPTPEPTDGPVTFPDGAELSIQMCGSSGFHNSAIGRPEENACEVDGSSVEGGDVWAVVVFAKAGGDDTLTVQLMENGQGQNEQEFTIRSKLDTCGASCNGLLYGAQYTDLLSGDYKVVLQRNGEFADSATFTVE